MPDKIQTICIVLAAGASSRMGKAKQLLELNGQPMVSRMCFLAKAAGFDAVLVVTGARQKLVEKAVPDFAYTAHNTNWASGMGSSVYTGLTWAIEHFPELSCAGVILTDQPFLSSALLTQMLRSLKDNDEASGAAAFYQGQLGVPALFSAALFPELLELKSEKGAKAVLKKHQDTLLAIPFPKGGFDLDFPEDWEHFLQQSDQ